MKIGCHIKEIREVEKNYKRSYVAQKLNITTRAYANIENDITGITVNRLQEIASILDCSISYILKYRQSKKEFYNHFHNYSGNKGVNILNQGVRFSNFSLPKLQEELLQSQRERIALLETLLKQNNINF